MDHEALRSFVVDAHRNGYAAGGADAVADDGAKLVEYRDGDWRYLDRYHGSRSFVGRETVFHDGTPVWGMHYHGAPTDETVDPDALYAFLRDALSAASRAAPFRGPPSFEGERFSYAADAEGSLERFTGTETVTADGTTVYRGRFGGCTVE